MTLKQTTPVPSHPPVSVTDELDLQLLTFVIDWRCNSRCTTCTLWQVTDDTGYLTHDEMDALFAADCLRGIPQIYLTGGEPFIRKDLVDIARIVRAHHPDAVLSMTTNGLTPGRVRRMAREMLALGDRLVITVSLNGSAPTHDASRGVPGNYDKVMTTCDYLAELGIEHGFQFTVFPFNKDEIETVCDLANERGIPVSYEFGRDDVRYGVTDGGFNPLTEEHREIADTLLRLSRRDERHRFAAEYARRRLNGESHFDCLMLSHSLYLDPVGDVFACDGYYDDLRLGSVKEQSLDEILRSDRAAQVLGFIRGGGCQPCDVSCCLLQSLRYHEMRRGDHILRRVARKLTQ